MKINDIDYTSLWYDDARDKVLYIDQTRLPHELVIREMKTFDDGIRAITNMEVRGAPLIGVAAAFAMYVGMREYPGSGMMRAETFINVSTTHLETLAARLIATRPTAVNLAWAVNEMLEAAGVIPAKAGTATLTRTADGLTPGPSPATWDDLTPGPSPATWDDLPPGPSPATWDGLTPGPSPATWDGLTPGPSPATWDDLTPGPSPATWDDLTPGPSPATWDDLTPGPSPALPAVAGEGGATAGLFASRITRHASRLLQAALDIRQRELDNSYRIGLNGLKIIRAAFNENSGRPVNILTHCNAGWLATVDYGTALAPIYLAHDSGIPVHVWVDETRPRNQGAKLTAYELSRHGVPCTLITDNAGGLLMQQGKVDMVIVGADRITANGDVVNKVGTYLKALAARDNKVPFYVAAPSSTFDAATPTGADVEIEERSADEVLLIEGVPIAPEGTKVWNPGFDVTPGGMVTGYLKESDE